MSQNNGKFILGYFEFSFKMHVYKYLALYDELSLRTNFICFWSTLDVLEKSGKWRVCTFCCPSESLKSSHTAEKTVWQCGFSIVWHLDDRSIKCKTKPYRIRSKKHKEKRPGNQWDANKVHCRRISIRL